MDSAWEASGCDCGASTGWAKPCILAQPGITCNSICAFTSAQVRGRHDILHLHTSGVSVHVHVAGIGTKGKAAYAGGVSAASALKTCTSTWRVAYRIDDEGRAWRRRR